MGGLDNENGVIYVKNSAGAICVTIDCNGININNGAFLVDMNGNVNANNINAFGITGNAAAQFSQAVDNSEAMRLAKQAISDAANAASTANSAADQAQSAANQAQSAADAAQRSIDATNVHVANLNNTIIPDINNKLQEHEQRIAALGG